MNISRITTKVTQTIVPNKIQEFFKFKPAVEFFESTMPKQDVFKYSVAEISKTLDELPKHPKVFANNMNPKLQRFFDLTISAAATPVVGGVLGIATALSKIFNPDVSVRYISKRLGKFGKEMDFYKFTSTTYDANGTPYMSEFTKFMRKHSLDEFPQLIHVLKGDMSLVGPRAMRRQEINTLINQTDMRATDRFFVKQGFGFGDTREKTNMVFRREIESKNIENLTVRNYFKTLYNLSKNILLGKNK